MAGSRIHNWKSFIKAATPEPRSYPTKSETKKQDVKASEKRNSASPVSRNQPELFVVVDRFDGDLARGLKRGFKALPVIRKGSRKGKAGPPRDRRSS